MGNPIQIIILAVIVIAVIVVFFIISSAISLWIQGLVSGASVGLINIVFMRFRKIPPKLVVETKIMAVKAGIEERRNALCH